MSKFISLFRNLKISNKLGIGFGVVLVLTCFVAILGYKQINMLGSRIFKIDSASNIINSSNMARINALYYIWKVEDKYADGVEENLGNLIDKAEEVKPEFTSKDDQDNINAIIQSATNYKRNFATNYVKARTEESENIYSLYGISNNIEKVITRVLNDQESDYKSLSGNNSSIEKIQDKVQKIIDGNLVAKNFMAAKSNSAFFFYSSKSEYFESALAEIQKAENVLVQLRGRYNNPAHVRAADELLSLLESYKDGLQQVVDARVGGNNTVKELAGDGVIVQKAVETILSGQLRKTQERLAISKSTMIWGAVIIVLIGLAFAILITRGIVKPIKIFSNKMVRVREDNDFSERVDILSKDEVGQAAVAFNGLIESVQAAISDAIEVVSSIAAGSFERKVIVDVKGDLDNLKQGINFSVDNMKETMDALNTIMQSMAQGEFSKRIEVDLKGEYKKSADTALESMQALDNAILSINSVMASVAQADLSRRIEIKLLGDLGKLKQNINQSLDAVSNAVDDITRLTVALSDGNLKERIVKDHPGQFGILKNALNQTMNNVSEVVSNIATAADIVSSASNEIADGNSDMSKRTEEQASSLEETASSMEELTSTVKQNAENASQANQIAVSARQTADHGGSIVNQAVQAMEEINTSSTKIADIIGVIDEIAFQTNLLALNASVEAARAGEQGRGFAVVATEVRNLAQRSATAAKEIKELIQDSVVKVKAGSDLVEQSGKTLNDIVSGVKKVGDMIAEIAAASHEQTAGIGQVNQALANMDDITQRNAALAEEASANSENLSSQAQSMSEQVRFFDL